MLSSLGSAAEDAELALGERRQSGAEVTKQTGLASDAQADAADTAASGMTWRHIMGIIGLITGLLVMVVYLSNPEQSWGIIQKPLIAVSIGLGAWLFCFRWPTQWIWVGGSLAIAASSWLLLATQPWQQAVGLAAVGFGGGRGVRGATETKNVPAGSRRFWS